LDQIVLKPEQNILDSPSRSPKFKFRRHSPGEDFQLLRILPRFFICKLFKAGCKLVSLCPMAFLPAYAHVKTIGEFITHVQYVVETCSATYFVGNFNGDISLTSPKIPENAHCTWSKHL